MTYHKQINHLGKQFDWIYHHDYSYNTKNNNNKTFQF